MIDIHDFLLLFAGVKQTGENQWMAKCPCHDDRQASLAISIGKKGGIILEDHAGCNKQRILESVGLTFADISPGKSKPPKKGERFDWHNIAARYEYRNGNRKLRDINKNFAWQHREGKEWKPRRNSEPPCLFTSGNPADTVYIVEGEKDTINLSKCGFYCVCSEHGASNGNGNKWHPEYTRELSGKDIRIIADNDDIGRAFAHLIATNVISVAKSVKVFDLRDEWADIPAKGDISDLLDTFGKDETIKRLEHLERNTELFCKGVHLECDRNGKPLSTAENFLRIFRNDPHFSNIRLNVLKDFPEKVIDGKILEWNDRDDAIIRNYIEKEYHLYNRAKCMDAFNEFLSERECNPLVELLSTIEWDGMERCKNFLHKWMHADDTQYTREVSRLIFAGGIARAMNPGAKFDEVCVLIGKQGGGKSTLSRWLAIDDSFYTSLKSIAGKAALDNLRGKWIIELEELLATVADTKSSEERAKAFISTQTDYYRESYGHRSQGHPRCCIFIGTTNRDEFLTDKTGNRRWYPVRCNPNITELYELEDECKNDIRQCWAEMLHAYRNGNSLAEPCPDRSLLDIIHAEQYNAMEDDYRVGLIGDYLEGKDRVCIAELWQQAINSGNPLCRELSPKDSRAIAAILTHEFGWKRDGSKHHTGYGTQKSYIRPDKSLPF